MDDRYWIHYIGHSIARAQLLLNRLKIRKFGSNKYQPTDRTYEKSGYIFRTLPASETRILVSGKKGGIFTLFNKEKQLVSNFGWIARDGNKLFVNHWWADDWKFAADDKKVHIEGFLYPHKEKTSKPVLHMGLRIVSWLFGSRLTRMLRNVLIFKSKSSAIAFERKIDLAEEEVIVTDTIDNIEKKVQLLRATRASKRHVASADSWHQEDFILSEIEEPAEMIIRKDKKAVITTTYKI